MRKSFFKKGEYFHLFNKSIANFNIFKSKSNSIRFLETLDYYNNNKPKTKLSIAKDKQLYCYNNLIYPKSNSILKFISYCVMPDHYHLLIKTNYDDMLSKFINIIENSYTRFFNSKYKRKGPLWQSAFKAVIISSNEQLLHTTRYLHLNPTTSGYVKKPEDWQFSSYKDFITNPNLLKRELTEITISNNFIYQRFVENNLDYQRKLRIIKKLII